LLLAFYYSDKKIDAVNKGNIINKHLDSITRFLFSTSWAKLANPGFRIQKGLIAQKEK
jgi:hypothetical protein